MTDPSAAQWKTPSVYAAQRSDGSADGYTYSNSARNFGENKMLQIDVLSNMEERSYHLTYRHAVLQPLEFNYYTYA